MTSISYAGTAGGQPRLFIPTMNQVTDAATQTALQAILQWANTLVAGGSGISGWAAGTLAAFDTATGNCIVDLSTFGTTVTLEGDSETISNPDGITSFVFCSLSINGGTSGYVQINVPGNTEAGSLYLPYSATDPTTNAATQSIFEDSGSGTFSYTESGGFDVTTVAFDSSVVTVLSFEDV